MADDPRFGPSAQTPQQRAYILAQMQLVIPNLKRTSPYAQQLYNQYITGELSWPEVRAALDAGETAA